MKTRFVASVLATLFTTALLAQSERGTITGTVQDATGAVVPDAKVTLANGLQFLTSYALSKLLTDADGYWPGGAAMDPYNRRLEKSIGQYDITHNLKFSAVWDLPVGRGRLLNVKGPADWIVGGWRISAIATYSSGTPHALATTNSLPLFGGGLRPIISTYDGWQPATRSDHFDPALDRTIQPASFFSARPANTFGNMTRYNPKFRAFPNYNENFSLAKTFPVHEQIRLDFRAEMFNAFNRVRFGQGSLTVQSQTFGILSQTAGDQIDSPRQMQLALKVYF